MEESKPITHITAGLIIGTILIILSVISIYLIKNPEANRYSQWLTYIVIIAGLIVFINLHAKSLNYQTTFGELFSYGFKTTAIFTLIVLGFVVLFNLMVPDFRNKGMDLARQNLEEQGKLTDAQIDQAIEITKKYFWVIAIGGTLLGNLIIGVIGSLIGAAVTKKQPKNPLEQLNA